ncbi:MAG TPA: hypothetical protein VIC35_05780 [Acidimicrobiia bacterium]|jgi:hypothetical protein
MKHSMLLSRGSEPRLETDLTAVVADALDRALLQTAGRDLRRREVTDLLLDLRHELVALVTLEQTMASHADPA